MTKLPLVFFWIALTFFGSFSSFAMGNATVSAALATCQRELVQAEQGRLEPIEAPEYQVILQKSPRLGDYTLVELESPHGKTKVIIDAQAQWLVNAVERFTKKPFAQTNQNDIKAFLTAVHSMPIAELLSPTHRAYADAPRHFDSSHPVYFLEEMLLSNNFPDYDLATMLIGQALIERVTKKQAAVVKTAQGQYGLLIRNKSPDFFSVSCKADCWPVSQVALSVEIAPVSDKNNRRLELFDLNGHLHSMAVVGRSPLEKMVRAAGEQYRAAQGDDLVEVEFDFMPQFYPDGHTFIRIGDVGYNFGLYGWSKKAGTEGVKGELLTNPWLRNLIKAYAGVDLPNFTIAIVMELPKNRVQKMVDAIEHDLSLPPDQRLQFDGEKQNCNQVTLRFLQDAGLFIASPDGYSGMSSSWTIRELFLHPPAATKSINIYPMPGAELTDGQLRSLFPRFIYRHHTIQNDETYLGTRDKIFVDYLRANILQDFNLAMNADSTFEHLKSLALFEDGDRQEYDQMLESMRRQGWILNDMLTVKGQEELGSARARYNLEKMRPQ